MAARTAASRRGEREITRRRSQDIDLCVGARMRERRLMLGLTQHELAELIGVTYQQAHKYEKGVNRIAAGRLYQIAQTLGVEVGYFFDGMDSERSFKPTPQQRRLLELARNFAGISDARHREALCHLARELVTVEPTPRRTNTLRWRDAPPGLGAAVSRVSGRGRSRSSAATPGAGASAPRPRRPARASNPERLGARAQPVAITITFRRRLAGMGDRQGLGEQRSRTLPLGAADLDAGHSSGGLVFDLGIEGRNGTNRVIGLAGGGAKHLRDRVGLQPGGHLQIRGRAPA